MEHHSSAPVLESGKQKQTALKIRFKPPRKREQDNIASSSSSSTAIVCSECSLSFPSKKALFGHLRVHRKSNRGAGKTSLSRFAQVKHADAIAACILMGMSRSRSETDIDDAKLCRLRWICSKIERQTKKVKEGASNQSGDQQSIIYGKVAPSLGEHSAGQCKTTSSNEEGNAGEVVDLMEVEMHPCDQCDKVFNSGQALGGHKRAHYTGPPLYRPGSNGRSQAAAVAAEVAVRDFDLNMPAEEEFL